MKLYWCIEDSEHNIVFESRLYDTIIECLKDYKNSNYVNDFYRTYIIMYDDNYDKEIYREEI